MADVDMTELEQRLQEFTRKGMEEAVQKGLEKACIIVEVEAKENCPVDDGTLRASITHDIEGCTGYVGSNVEYAPYIHNGTGIYAVKGDGRKEVPWRYQDVKGNWHTTSGQKPNPFLQNAIEKKQNEVRKQFEGLV